MRKLLSPFGQFLFTISPGVPVDLRKRFAGTRERSVGIISLLYGFFFCFCFTALICWSQGTLYGSDPNRLYFLKDRWNIILYVVVCPVYVALSCRLIIVTFKHWAALSDFAHELAPASRPPEARRLSLALFTIFLLCAFFITNYMYDVLDPNNVKTLYWFMNEAAGGPRTLNRAGYYYVVLNFSLLFITALGIFCFFSLALEVIWVGNGIKTGKVSDFRILRKKLDSFTEAYVIAKLLAADYIVNAFIWKASPLGQTANLRAAGLVLTAVGVFFLAVPRLYVELKWFQYRTLSAGGPDEEEDYYKDLRRGKLQIWMHVLDTFFFGGFVASFWGLDVNLTKLLGG